MQLDLFDSSRFTVSEVLKRNPQYWNYFGPIRFHPWERGLSSSYDAANHSDVLAFQCCSRCRKRTIAGFILRIHRWEKTGVGAPMFSVMRSQLTMCAECRRRPTDAQIRDAAYEWLKTNVPCADCGKTYAPGAMEFDHLPGYEKIADLSKTRSFGLAEFIDEVKKCDIVCANCHRIRTAVRHERG